jgi:hypothetical protein
MVLLLLATQPIKLFQPDGCVFTAPLSKVSEKITPAPAEALELLTETELLERDEETELLKLLERDEETELLERDEETELLERDEETELLERDVEAELEVVLQPVPVTAGTSAAPALLVP